MNFSRVTFEMKYKKNSPLKKRPSLSTENLIKLVYPEAREFHASGVRLFKEKRNLDAFHMFKNAYKLAVLGNCYLRNFWPPL